MANKKEKVLARPSKNLIAIKDRMIAHLKANPMPLTSLQLQAELGVTKHNRTYGLVLAVHSGEIVKITNYDFPRRCVTYRHKDNKPCKPVSAPQNVIVDGMLLLSEKKNKLGGVVRHFRHLGQ